MVVICPTAYKSQVIQLFEDKIKDNTAAIFVNGLIKSGHTSVLEHGTVYLIIHENNLAISKYQYNKYSVVATSDDEEDENGNKMDTYGTI